MRQSPRGRAFVGIIAAVLLLLAAGQAASLFKMYLDHPRYPLWDAAQNGLSGYELVQDLRNGRPLLFLHHLNEQDWWPFGFSLLMVPFFLVGEWAGLSTYASATLFSTTCFVLIPLVLFWAAREVDGGWVGLWSGILAAVIFLSSPLPRLYSILIMREPAGMLFSLSAFCFYLRARRLGTRRGWSAAGLATLGLFFIKYNYGLMWMFALCAVELTQLECDDRRRLTMTLARLVQPRGGSRWSAAWRVGLALYLCVTVALGLFVSSELAGAVLYPGLVAAAAALLLSLARQPEAVRGWWRTLAPRYRAALATIVFPLWVWNLYPDRLRRFFAFLFAAQQRAGGWSLDAPLYYLRSWLDSFVPDPWSGVALLVLAVSSLWVLNSRTPWRVLQITTLCAIVLVIAYPFEEQRFLAPAAPFLVLLGALSYSRWVHSLPLPRARPVMGGILCAVAAAGITLLCFESCRESYLLEHGYLPNSVPYGFEAGLEYIGDATEGTTEVAVVGHFNELSLHLIDWTLRHRAPERDLRLATLMKPVEPGLPPADLRRRMRDEIEGRSLDRIVAIRLSESSPWYRKRDFQLYNLWQLDVIDALAEDPAWVLIGRKYFDDPGLEIFVFEPEAPLPNIGNIP